MPNTAASCCSSSSGSGASEPRATVCNDTVVSAPATAPTVIQPAILSLWLIGKGPVLSGVGKIYTCEADMTQSLLRGSRDIDGSACKSPAIARAYGSREGASGAPALVRDGRRRP